MTAHLTRSIDIHRDVPELLKELAAHGRWDAASSGYILSQVSGGITNALYLVRDRRTNAKVLIRIYGIGTEDIIDRESDTSLFKYFGSIGFGPELLLTFNNGRVEQYLPSRTLDYPDMALKEGSPAVYEVVHGIAARVAHLHSLSPPDVSPAARNTPCLWRVLHRWFAQAAAFGGYDAATRSLVRPKPSGGHNLEGFQRLVARIQWGTLATELQWLPAGLRCPSEHVRPTWSSPHGSPPPASSSSRPSVVSRKSGSISDRVPGAPAPVDPETPHGRAIAFAHDLVLCHNDLLSGNILLRNLRPDSPADADVVGAGAGAVGGAVGADTDVVPTDDGEPSVTTLAGASQAHAHAPHITLIDYEYCAYNYRAYDIANHFCEWAGFEFDLERWFPSRSDAVGWLRSYVREWNQLQVPPRSTAPQTPDSSRGGSDAADRLDGERGGSADEWEVGRATSTISDSDGFLEHLADETLPFALASHLWWAAWAVLQASTSQLDFDFQGYAVRRLKAYEHHASLWFNRSVILVKPEEPPQPAPAQ